MGTNLLENFTQLQNSTENSQQNKHTTNDTTSTKAIITNIMSSK